MRWKQFLTPVKNMDAGEAGAYIRDHREGTYTLLDVRQPSEYEEGRIPGAKLIPLPELPNRLEEIDPEKPLITYWAMGGRSRAAAQMLSGMGFGEVYNLKGGMKAWQGLKAEGPPEMGMKYVTGDETPEEIIVLAYGMEDGLGDFYSTMAGLTDDEEVKAFLKSLSQVEDAHKKKLYGLYLDLHPETEDRDALESGAASNVMEGGFTTEDFIESHRSDVETVEGVIMVSMMLETQALDLYSRYSHRSKDANAKRILQDIGDEEKAHLEKLGRLMDEKHGQTM